MEYEDEEEEMKFEKEAVEEMKFEKEEEVKE
jgi:hypothetical protein